MYEMMENPEKYCGPAVATTTTPLEEKKKE
jgi:hypothetical protein